MAFPLWLLEVLGMQVGLRAAGVSGNESYLLRQFLLGFHLPRWRPSMGYWIAHSSRLGMNCWATAAIDILATIVALFAIQRFVIFKFMLEAGIQPLSFLIEDHLPDLISWGQMSRCLL
jgi:hypothetical protein